MITANELFQNLPQLSDEQLKQNYLKSREAIELMLPLLEDEAQGLRIVKLALEVDLGWGARLAGLVKTEFQEKTIALVT